MNAKKPAPAGAGAVRLHSSDWVGRLIPAERPVNEDAGMASAEAGAADHKVILAVLIGLLVAVSIAWTRGGDQPTLSPATTSTHAALPDDPRGTVYELPVRRADDGGKAGDVRGVVGWKFMDAETDGESPDQLRFVFDQPAEILSIHVSVDVTDTRLSLVEVMAGVNIEGYGEDRTADPLLHASYVDHTRHGEGGAIDQTATFTVPVAVAAGDYVGVAAWLGGDMPARISPEIVVTYRWA